MQGVKIRFATATLLALCGAVFAQCGGSSTKPDTTGNPPPAAAALASVKVSADSIIGGGPLTGTVTLTTTAPSGGAAVTLTSSNTDAATVTSPATVAAGAAGTEFTVTTKAVGASTPVTIAGSYLGVVMNAAFNVLPVPVTVRAAFTYTPNTSPPPPAGQCSVTRTTTGSLMNILRCRFDASTSTPNPGITNYRWQFPGASPIDQPSPIVSDPLVPCGTFSGSAARDVVLTVTAPQGTNATTTTITFVKGAEC